MATDPGMRVADAAMDATSLYRANPGRDHTSSSPRFLRDLRASAFRSSIKPVPLHPMQPALHRSIIFWAGILSVAFTCWAWWDSCNRVSEFQWGQVTGTSTAHGLLICRHSGGNYPLDVETKPVLWKSSPPAFPAPFLVHSRASGGLTAKHRLTLKEAYQLSFAYSPPGSWALYLPYWLILLLLIPTWLTLILLRARRLKHAQDLTTPS